MSDSPESYPYQRVAGEFRARIASGDWPPGYRLPARSRLARELLGGNGGENVIRRAQELLIEEGLLEARAGSGTYVRRLRPRHTLRAPFDGLVPDGYDGTWEASSQPRTPAPVEVAARLGVEADAPCVRTAYAVLTAGGEPVLTVTSWEPMEITGATPVVLPSGGLLACLTVPERMAHLGIAVTRVAETLTPVVLDRDQAQRVSAPSGSPAHVISRVHYDADDRPVETADLLIPAAHWDLLYIHQVTPAEHQDGAAGQTGSVLGTGL
ncbi:GntR family transcriptional regulator [Streptomyces graminilatus]|uniref:GntR family transcriptional regulator n=1 Tax=Streptomyces graminilatus TaxID=1464070 RepID=UPI0006E32F16|nr:GntR family transcriptional regulator [Streptomyces graminilatus]